MTPYIALGVIICLASLGVMWWLVFTAPHGHQDSDGYHAGEPHSDYDLED